jgi:hypothetical protein
LTAATDDGLEKILDQAAAGWAPYGGQVDGQRVVNPDRPDRIREVAEH